jgi:hypothetical protein
VRTSRGESQGKTIRRKDFEQADVSGIIRVKGLRLDPRGQGALGHGLDAASLQQANAGHIPL